MKKLILTCNVITFLLLIISGCRRPNNNDNFCTITGKFLQSCDNPVPVSGHSLMLAYTYNSNGKYAEIPCTTLEDGSFSFTYEKAAIMGELVIRGSRANGQGTLNYMYGIPIGKNLNIGEIYQKNNFFAIARLKPQRPTNSMDTLFYGFENGKFRSFVVGPFSENQEIDTTFVRNAQFYDFNNSSKYQKKSHSYYAWKLGENGRVNDIFALHQPCLKFNYFDIKI